MNIAIVGLGYWGKQYLRNFRDISLSNPRVQIKVLCDPDLTRIQQLQHEFQLEKSATHLCDQVDLVPLEEIDSVIIASPASTHFTIAKYFLLNKIHCLVEKPLCLNSHEGEQLIQLSKINQVHLMVGHTLLFSQEVGYLKTLLQRNEIGKLLSAETQRLNLGKVHHDCDVIWDLAPHDLAVLIYLNPGPVIRVHATGKAFKKKGQLDYASLQVEFDSGLHAQLLFSWIDPRKTRKISLVSENQKIVFDDCKHPGSINIFKRPFYQDFEIDETDEPQLQGDVLIPELLQKENLRNLCDHFWYLVDKQISNEISPGELGLKIIEIIEAAQESIEKNGLGIELKKTTIS